MNFVTAEFCTPAFATKTQRLPIVTDKFQKAMISLRTRKTKEAFLEDGIALIPESESKTESLLEIRDAADSIFAPTVSAGACVVVREIIPSVAVRTVIFPYRAPLPLA